MSALSVSEEKRMLDTRRSGRQREHVVRKNAGAAMTSSQLSAIRW